METEITKIKGDWREVLTDCRATVGKEALDKEPSEQFKRAILIAEHSPIRDIIIKWRWNNIKSWIATHWVRHKWECFVKTQRTDRTGINRDELPQSALVTFTGEANVQHLIDTWRKRLCHQAAPETRQYAEDFKMALHDVQPEIADALVPNCVYRCGCPEMQSCGYWDKLMVSSHSCLNTCSIRRRYAIYNDLFLKQSDIDSNSDSDSDSDC